MPTIRNIPRTHSPSLTMILTLRYVSLTCLFTYQHGVKGAHFVLVTITHTNHPINLDHDSRARQFPLAHTGMDSNHPDAYLTDIVIRSTGMLFRTETFPQLSMPDSLSTSVSLEWLKQKKRIMWSLARKSLTSSTCRKYVFHAPRVILEYANT